MNGQNKKDAAWEARRGGFTVIELLAGIFVLAVPLLAMNVVATRADRLAGVLAGLVVFAVCVLTVIAFYSWVGRRREKEFRELNEQYPLVYRVIAVPNETKDILKAQGAEIECGDFGWEAEPIESDGLTYLQGLTKQWCVAWYAGFRPDQIEKVGPKPRSQYSLPYSWVCGGAIPPTCPYPVQSNDSSDLGHPSRISRPFVQGQRRP